MRKLAIPAIILASVMLAGCVETVLSAADIGIQVAKTIKRARADKPDDFLARARFYAEFYCDIREEKNLDFNEIRQAAITAGAPEDKVDLVKGLIDKACPDAA